MVISLISFIFLFFIFFEKIFNPQVPLGYSSLLFAIIFFSGIQILFLGFIGEYIGKILKTVNNAQFLIDNIKADTKIY